jgi:hypothetical protein
MATVPRPNRRMRRMQAIDFILSDMGNPDEFTSHEVWYAGERMLSTVAKWPPYTKMSFKGFKGKESLTNTLRFHPRIEKVGYSNSKARGRERTTLFRSKKE